MDYPVLIFVLSFLLMWCAALLGQRMGHHLFAVSEDLRSDFSTVQAATLTLLGLIIGFSFSMATGRYDLRKTYEEAEANAIGTEYLRVDVLGPANAARLKEMLRRYTDLRIQFYVTPRSESRGPVNAATAALQNDMWVAASRPAMELPSALTMQAVSGMNDVINSQGYTQAAWWNRIPVAAWILMFTIGVFCNAMLGYGAKRPEPKLFVVLPLVVSIAFFLIADIDSPRGGLIRVVPQNLIALRSGLGQ